MSNITPAACISGVISSADNSDNKGVLFIFLRAFQQLDFGFALQWGKT